MGHLERGEKNVSYNTLLRLAEALKITVSELVSDDHRPDASQPKRRATRRGRTMLTDDLEGIVRELNFRRTSLEEAALALRNVTVALRKRANTRRNTLKS